MSRTKLEQHYYHSWNGRLPGFTYHFQVSTKHCSNKAQAYFSTTYYRLISPGGSPFVVLDLQPGVYGDILSAIP